MGNKKNNVEWNNLADKKPIKNGDYLCYCRSIGGKYMDVLTVKLKGTIIEKAVIPYALQEDIWTEVLGTTKKMNGFIVCWAELPEAPL